MENARQWEDVRARSEALRRRVIAEEQAVEGSPGKAAVAIDRPDEAPDPIEDEEFFDIFAPPDEGLGARLMKKPDPAEAAERRKAAYAKEFLEWKKNRAEFVKSQQLAGLDSYAMDASAFRDNWNAIWGRGYGPFEATSKFSISFSISN
jgi:hypothetical protein